MLDAEEYLYLAINASKSGNHHASMEYLHKCIEMEPQNPQAIYLLAAEHAELGLFERAISGMETALAIDPGMDMASFQLGMLYSRNGQNDKAAELWTRIKEGSPDAALQMHSSAMLELLAENYQDALVYIKKGLMYEGDNPALGEMMRNLMVEASKKVSQHSDSEDASAENDDSQAKKPVVFLGAYKDKTLSEE